ncbi:MAG: dihydroorotase [Bacteroidales bacterium 36-12]|nr:MAG: dihydroorotase [Bacteroidales bacterium 36-12]
MSVLIKNAEIINEGQRFVGSVLIEDEYIKEVYSGNAIPDNMIVNEIIDATGMILMPGVIDDQVHFREPGLTHKADIHTESMAAVAGGVTSFMEMPNTNPQTTTIQELENKYLIGAEKSLANYAFYMGATNDNIDELRKLKPSQTCGVKVFMGSSTGNMLVDNRETLSRIFAEIPFLIATHCEDEDTIRKNKLKYIEQYGDNLPVQFHPLIRDAEACYKSSSFAVELATKYNARLHVLHLSTAREIELFNNKLPLKEKKITSEACVHHLWFSDKDYAKYGNKIKWNPAIKSEDDKLKLIEALKNDLIDVVATDHAPHLESEKEGNCLKAASGGPLLQFSLLAMLEMVENGTFTIEQIVKKMCHAPSDLFRVEKRGYIKSGYYADLVLINPAVQTHVTKDIILSKCGWSPFEGDVFKHSIAKTWVNGKLAYNNGKVEENIRGRRLMFSDW